MRSITALVVLWALQASALATAAVSLHLSWDANTEANIAGYRVHYGTTSDPYTEMIQVTGTSAAVSNLVPGTSYLVAVSAFNSTGAESAFSTPINVVAGSSSVQAATLDNISTRALVQTGDNVVIGGFIIESTSPKEVVLRGIGPSLADEGVSGVLQDPVLELRDANGELLASNDNWSDGNSAELISLGLAPKKANESAIVISLPAGAYSASIHGQSSQQGVALFELYNLDHSFGSVANISTRALVNTGDQVMIGGFIISGTQPTKIIARALGPSLTALGVPGALADPILDLYDSDGMLVSSNDDWRATQESAIVATNLSPTNDHESAIVSTLTPGAYSAVVSGKNGGTGVGLFEVYALAQ